MRGVKDSKASPSFKVRDAPRTRTLIEYLSATRIELFSIQAQTLHEQQIRNHQERNTQTMSSKKIVVAFDLYGTLLSTESIAKQLAEHFGQEKGQTIAALWRRYQLEYTWRLNSMGKH